MCRLLGYCSRGSTPVAGLLTEDGLRDFTALSRFHADGWGMAWYDTGGPRIEKSVRRAAEEPAYGRLAHRSLGDIGLVHLRWATPGLGLGRDNSHPFRYGRYSFAHNGAIHPQQRLGEMVPGEWDKRLTGTTDQATADAVVTASSGWPQPGWDILPNGSVLTVDRTTLKTSVASFDAVPAGVGGLPGSGT